MIVFWRCLRRCCRLCFSSLIGSFSNDDGKLHFKINICGAELWLFCNYHLISWIRRCWWRTLQEDLKERRSSKHRELKKHAYFYHSTNQILNLWPCHSRCRRGRFTVVCSSCHQNGQCGNFTLLFCRGRHELVHKCVPHVQHAYFSSLDQSNSQFVKLSSPLPSWIALAMTTATTRKTAVESKHLHNCDYLGLSHLVRIL